MIEIYNLKSTFSKIATMSDLTNSGLNVVPISLIKIDDTLYVEYVLDRDVPAFLREMDEKIKITAPATQVIESKELTEAKNTILNTDPFGNRHAGQTLGEIVKDDPAWVQKALKEMTNKYIRDRLELIVESEGK